MSINWFFYNFSSSSAGLHVPVNASVSSALNENFSTVTTIDSMIPKKLSHSSINSYQWLPLVGGTSYAGCTIFLQTKIDGQWWNTEESIKALDGIKNFSNIGLSQNTLQQKILTLKEWDNFGVFQYRMCLYIPSGANVSNFFLGMVRSSE